MKKIFNILLVFALMICLAGCGKTYADDVDNINYDIDLNNKPELSVLMPNSGYDRDTMNNDPNAKLIETLTGYKTTYTQLPSTDASKTLNNELMDKRHYNVMKLTKGQFADLVKDDMLLDITQAINVFGQDLLANISEESWDVVRFNGKIYGIPERASSDNIEYPIVFNQDLLFECNLDIPTTLAEFENTLKVLTEKTGKPALTFDRYTPLVYAISSAFGIYTDWHEYTVNGKTEVLFYMNAPRYKEYVDYMNSLYQRGYIDQTVATNTSSDAISKFTSGNAAAVACSIWSVPAIVSGLQANNKISAIEASGTLENYIGYLRALKENDSSEEKVYRSSGYTYITAIPYYEAENAGYAIDWMNSKIRDTDEEHNFRTIVLGTEGVHWTYNAKEGYLPIAANFSEKDTASFYLTGSNENKYTDYWKARVRKQPELFRAWSIMMSNADRVGEYNIVDFAPVIDDYNKNRSAIEEYSQDQFYMMLREGTSKLNDYLNKLNGQQKCKTATEAINNWYKSYKNK